MSPAKYVTLSSIFFMFSEWLVKLTSSNSYSPFIHLIIHLLHMHTLFPGKARSKKDYVELRRHVQQSHVDRRLID